MPFTIGLYARSVSVVSFTDSALDDIDDVIDVNSRGIAFELKISNPDDNTEKNLS